MNRYSLKNQILSLTCLPNSTKRVFFIPQFDLLSLGAQISGLLYSFSFFYIYNMKNTLPNFVEVKKIRSKKLYVNLNEANDTSNSVEKTFNNETVIFNNMYN